MEFQKFDKIPRLSRDCIITEKIDGTNGQIFIINYDKLLELTGNVDEQTPYIMGKFDNLYVFAGSRKRWLDTSSNGDNHGFAKWVQANAEELLKLGKGRHYGEWYGKGIQRGYGLNEKRFALFNVGKWNEENKPKCCDVVPILYKGMFDTSIIQQTLNRLEVDGSKISPGFMNPEGVVIYHTASGKLFKKTIKNDEKPKGN